LASSSASKVAASAIAPWASPASAANSYNNRAAETLPASSSSSPYFIARWARC
jgi:hypothetical protein